MNHHIYHLLRAWYPRRDESNWVLISIVETKGSSYRKAGAMMLFNEDGEQLGVVSGGCLESDLLHQARKAWSSGRAKLVTYDMQEEGDIAWRLGIGCGGEVTLLLQPVTAKSDYLQLPKVLFALAEKKTVGYCQPRKPGVPSAFVSFEPGQRASDYWFWLSPPPSLAILGGGGDALPLCDMAARLGWDVYVNDPRARYARKADFVSATITEGVKAEELNHQPWFAACQAVVVMHHQVVLDAEALQAVAAGTSDALRYLALLGPVHRANRVLKEARLCGNAFSVPLSAPAGLALGGDLPESIALSILSEAHAAIYQKSATSLKGKSCQAS